MLHTHCGELVTTKRQSLDLGHFLKAFQARVRDPGEVEAEVLDLGQRLQEDRAPRLAARARLARGPTHLRGSMRFYNHRCLHSALGYRSPLTMSEEPRRTSLSTEPTEDPRPAIPAAVGERQAVRRYSARVTGKQRTKQ